jgi:hypothetical protein
MEEILIMADKIDEAFNVQEEKNQQLETQNTRLNLKLQNLEERITEINARFIALETSAPKPGSVKVIPSVSPRPGRPKRGGI